MLNPGTDAWDYIIAGLQKFWSPETICNCWRQEHPDAKPLHYSTIYRYIARGKFPNIKPKTHLHRSGKQMQTRNTNYNSIQPDRIIPEWPEAIQMT